MARDLGVCFSSPFLVFGRFPSSDGQDTDKTSFPHSEALQTVITLSNIE